MDVRDTINIINLPDEIIALILVNNDPRDILHFSATCKKFLKLVSNNDYLWKKKYSEIVPNAVVKLVTQHNGGNWLKKSMHYSELKEIVSMELQSMPSKYLNHWTFREMLITDARGFFTMATKDNLSYIYTICILQEIIKKGKSIIDTNQCLKPLYTLTTIYCAEKVLGYLLHTYQTMKWLQKEVKKELTPVFVINFFLQWIDVTNIYSDEDVEQKIQSLVTRVEAVLEESPSELKLSQQFGRKIYTEKQVLHAITKVIYNNNKVSTLPNSKTLNIVKVIDENDGDIISYGAIYQAVAKRFGLKCELIAFPNHLFLEWQCSDEKDKSYTINPFNGELRPKRQCPYSRGSRTNYKYCSASLLEFIYSSYKASKGPMKSCKTQNAMYLWDFLGDHNNDNTYHMMHLHMHTVQYALPLATQPTINMKYFEDEHLKMMLMLSRLDEKRREDEEVVNRSIVVKTRHEPIKYAVGMICYHTTYNYVCVIRGWEVASGATATRMSRNGHPRAKDQPFYWVMARDHSERYVSQRNLELVVPPRRMKDLEHSLAREFTHFDGFSYILNDQKVLEYPHETPYIEAFKRK